MTAPLISIHIRDTSLWHSTMAASARGAAFFNGELRRAQQLTELFAHIPSLEAARDVLCKLNGFFALIWRLPDGDVIAATDRSRSIPLFYGQTRGQLFISDDAYWVRDQVGDDAYDCDAAIEFAVTGYVTGADTLSPNVKQLQAGEMLCATETAQGVSTKARYYYRYKHILREDPGLAQLVEELGGICEASIERLIEFAAGRQIVLPLTGGLDSGRIALLLETQGYSNVLGFSYGRRGNQDSLDGENFARRLKIPWEFVPYTQDLWQHWFSMPERGAYYRLADGLSSLPILQEWPAILQLRQRGVLADDAVIVPGYTAEGFIRPADNPPDWPPFFDDRIDLDGVVQAILDLHYTLLDWSDAREMLILKFRERILAVIGDPAYFGSSTGIYENWCFCERQAKFITNAIRTYEFWGYDWWLPLWDAEAMEFWSKVPVPYRIQRRLTAAYYERLCKQVLKEVVLPRRFNTRASLTQSLARKARRWGERQPLIACLYAAVRRRLQYGTHPLAWYGMVRRDVFNQLYQGKANINTYLSLERLGLISFAGEARLPVEMPWERVRSLNQHRS